MERFSADHHRQHYEMKWTPCWACPMHHCHAMKVLDGPYAGYEGDEPEYEGWAAFGPLIGQTDVSAALVLSDLTDRLGMDCNETGWVLSFVMECLEKGVLASKDLDGLEMNWGNAEACRSLLHKITRRQGVGNVLAEGVKRSAEAIGGRALDIGVHIMNGHAPRGHDHWTEIRDVKDEFTLWYFFADRLDRSKVRLRLTQVKAMFEVRLQRLRTFQGNQRSCGNTGTTNYSSALFRD